ncbi:MAG TPA: PAS domain S-box protein [Thermoanaerobaculia bacterium]|nr:PAS domain S-box protein [Thermoanaerobaculia bacterium]
MIDHSPVRSRAPSAPADPQPDFRALFEGSPDPYLVLAPDLTIVAVSDAYLRATMTRRPEILGRGIFDVFPDNPADLTATGVSNLRASLERVLAQGVPDAMAVQKYDVRRPESAGGAFELRYWSPVNTPVFSATGELAFIIHRVEDVTGFIRLKEVGREQARETEELRQHAQQMEGEIYRRAQQLQLANDELRIAAEERYRSLFDEAPHPMWVVDAETLHFLEVNRKAVDHYGYSRQEFLAMTLLEIRPAEDIPGTLEGVRAVLAGEPRIGRRRHHTKAGQILQVSVASRPVTFAGRPALLAVVDDVTERHRLEAQLLQAQKMEAVGQLAGGVAHDFNNLLTVILGFAGMVAAGLGDRPRLLAQLDEVRKAGERGEALTSQLLAFSREQVLRPEIVDLNAVVSGIEPMLRRLLREDVKLAVSLQPALSAVKIDRAKFEQVIMNLAINARDAMPGGGELVITTADVELDAIYTADHPGVAPGPYVLLAVSDSGCGMDAATRARIFEPFFTTKEAGKGTGLGLSTVFGIVRQSGGSIQVYSEPGQGSTFKVFLPAAARDEAAREPAAAAVTPPAGGSETVLLIEDDPAVRELVRLMLEGAGYSVLVSETVSAAIAFAEQRSGAIHLVLTDLIMPEMSGVEAASRLTALRPESRVLYMSGYTGDILGRRGMLPEGAARLEKPFTQRTLLQSVRQVLDGGGLAMT